MLLVVLVVFSLQCFSYCQAKTYLELYYPASVIEDAHLDTAQLLLKYNYPAETHYVTTADNYIVCMHRIANPGGRPVLLTHGLFDTSAAFILMGTWSGLGYYLHDNGYDVWMGNARGNRYSRNHTKLNPNIDRAAFWSFSWHEMGVYDVPAMIDYVLELTGYQKLGYIGHSQGNIVFWIMASTLPAYNDKITMMQALAPVAYAKHITTPTKNIFIRLVALTKDILDEIFPHSNFFLNNCYRSKLTDDLCKELFWVFEGKDPEHYNKTMWPVVWGHLPAGINLKQAEHFVQIHLTDRFAPLDFGPQKNQRLYGQAEPPEYALEKITAPVGLHYGRNDHLSRLADVSHLAKRLPNVVVDKLYPYKNWNHAVLMWGIDARKLVHKKLIEEMRKYE